MPSHSDTSERGPEELRSSGVPSRHEYDLARALELLRIGAQLPEAQFREGQEDAIRHVVEGSGRLLVVQKTGWGKSFVYFIATKLLREQGAGPALLVSPLLALMRNQIAAAQRMGVRAETINSSNDDDWPRVEATLKNGEVDILLISPERLNNPHFRNDVLATIADRISLLVIDEAHCISNWGHDFRPHYRLIERIVRRLPSNLRVLATTATANNRVMEDLSEILGPDLEISGGDLARPSLKLRTIRLAGQAERLAWLAAQMEALPGHGIIYTLTVRDAEQVAAWLSSRGFNVAAYTGKTEEGRPMLEDALLANQMKALVATTALGMGFDKPDLAFVIHYQTPGSVVAYYQQVGRAGRALDAAYGVLLSGAEDTEITGYFIDSAFPTRDEAPDGLSIREIEGRVNVSYGRIFKTTLLLSLEQPAPIAKEGAKWKRTVAPLSDAFWERTVRLTSLRRDEQAQMQEYVGLEEGHMAFLIRALDGDPSGLTEPGLPLLPTTPDEALVRAASQFLRRTNVPIEPRKQWPVGGLPQFELSGLIEAAHRLEPGRTLSFWGDGGWGALVRRGKYHDGRFDDALVEACAELLADWNPQPAPRWVTCVPSLRHPELVPDFARRLAAKLGLPFHAAIDKTELRPEQKEMENSTQQARNVDGSLRLVEGKYPGGAVLLVDDIVDSRWTLTVAGWLLRSNGSGPVWPFALAQT